MIPYVGRCRITISTGKHRVKVTVGANLLNFLISESAGGNHYFNVSSTILGKFLEEYSISILLDQKGQLFDDTSWRSVKRIHTMFTRALTRGHHTTLIMET